MPKIERKTCDSMTKEKKETSGVEVEERRGFIERRKDVVDRRLGLDRRRGPGHRRSEERRSAEEGEMTDEQFEFLMAIDQYKRANQKPFPSWTEVLELVKALGYRKVAQPQSLESFRKEDRPQPASV
jgi:FMN phosphatase YigB (HAD superfamily)